MNIKIFVPLAPQNFAVAPARKKATPVDTSVSEDSLRELEERVRALHDYWFRLYGELDVWSDPKKRRAMMEARWAYHDAEAAWLSARVRKKGHGSGETRGGGS